MTTDFRSTVRLPAAAKPSTGCFVIGEVAQTHDGSLGQAHAFVDAIAAAGAHAIKFQTHIAAAESTPGEPWRVKFSRQDASRYDYWKRMEFTPEQWAGLKQHAEDRGLLFVSSPFSFEAVDLLEKIGMELWKVASGEVSNAPLLARLAGSKKPVMLSSGMSSLAELDAAVAAVRAAGAPVSVLQCTSMYPCPPEKLGLGMLEVFRERFACPVGLSDHSGTIFAGLAAATLGADVLELHVTMTREMFGPDVPSSVTTAELRQLMEGLAFVDRMHRGAAAHDKDAMAGELAPLRALFTKSIVARTSLPRGTQLTEAHLTLKKPGTGIPAARLSELIGRRLARDVAADTLLSEADLEARS